MPIINNVKCLYSLLCNLHGQLNSSLSVSQQLTHDAVSKSFGKQKIELFWHHEIEAV